MTREQFKKWLIDEVTIDGALSINLPEATYERIIDKELRTMYEINPDAMRSAYCVIPCSVFYTQEFRKNRTIKFPDCVLAISTFQEMKRRNAMFGISDPDFGFNRAFQADLWFGSHMNLDSVAFRTIQWSVWDQLKQFTLVDIQHSWNYASHELLVTGHDPKVDVYCGLTVKEDEQYLFDNIWVQKWIAAQCKLQSNNLLTLFSTNFVCGVTINMQSYVSEAEKDIEECKAKFIENSKVPSMYTIP